MTNTYDEYADKAAASYLQGRMDEQGAWVEAVKAVRAIYLRAVDFATEDENYEEAALYRHRAAVLDALLRRMGVE